jgi:hypothetical protein
MLSKEERRAVARRVFGALCEHYPDRYITLIEQQGQEEPSTDVSVQGHSGPEPVAKAS